MKFDKKLLVLAIAAAPVLALAQNTINFQGQVDATTCSVTIDGSATPVVLLATVPTSALTGSGSTAGEKAFNIAVTGCPPAVAALEVKTKFSSSNIAASGNLSNMGSAANVQLKIAAVSGGPGLNLVGDWTSAPGQGIPLVTGAVGGNRDYFVSYIAPGLAAGQGSVRAAMQYVVFYP